MEAEQCADYLACPFATWWTTILFPILASLFVTSTYVLYRCYAEVLRTGFYHKERACDATKQEDKCSREWEPEAMQPYHSRKASPLATIDLDSPAANQPCESMVQTSKARQCNIGRSVKQNTVTLGGVRTSLLALRRKNHGVDKA